jgi:hypothetical protein
MLFLYLKNNGKLVKEKYKKLIKYIFQIQYKFQKLINYFFNFMNKKNIVFE